MNTPSPQSWCARLDAVACQKPPSLVRGYVLSRLRIFVAAVLYLLCFVSLYSASRTLPAFMLSRLLKLLLMAPLDETNRSAHALMYVRYLASCVRWYTR